MKKRKGKDMEYTVLGVVFNKATSTEVPLEDFLARQTVPEQNKWVAQIEKDILSKFYNSKIHFTY